MKYRFLALVLVAAVLVGLAGCASSFTSISTDPNGQYVLTGWDTPGPYGFVWICDYDPDTKTLIVREEY